MIKIHDVIKNIVDKDIEVKNMLARRILNLSSYARSIKGEVEKETKKEVSIQSIVVSLSRIEKKIKAYNYLPSIKIDNLSVKKPVTELVYKKNKENLFKLINIFKLAIENEKSPFSFSVGTENISILISSYIVDGAMAIFKELPTIKKTKLASVGISFSPELVEESGVGFSLMQKISSKRIILDEVFSTFNEFTLIFNEGELPKVLEALEN